MTKLLFVNDKNFEWLYERGEGGGKTIRIHSFKTIALNYYLFILDYDLLNFKH